MLQIDYTALRSLKSGHTVDTAYQINVELARKNRNFSTVGNQAVALNGATVTTVHRRDIIYDLQTQMIQDASTPDNDDMQEFLDSVSSGETFQLDLEGVSEDYVLHSIQRPYRMIRVGTDDIFRYTFRVRKL